MTQTKRNFVTLDIERIHPDPTQPRLVIDTDLAESIKLRGILQPIAVEPAQPIEYECDHCGMSFAALADLGDWMINDGERRWTGARAAGVKSIDVEVLPVTTEAQRLVRQLTANSGKPLNPVEEALAYAALMQREGWSQVELAKQLGRPRSLVGDRVRLASLDPVWLELIKTGKLQVSHAPVLSQYSEVPSAYQAKARDTYIKSVNIGGEEPSISVEDFKFEIFEAFSEFLKPIAEVRGYVGPTVDISRYNDQKKRYAADPEIWIPRYAASVERAKEKAKEERQQRAAERTPSRDKKEKHWLDTIGDDIPKREGKGYNITAAKGEVKIYSGPSAGWGFNHALVPSVFLANVDRTKLIRVKGQYTDAALLTSDLAAVKLAEKAFSDQVDKLLEPEVVELRGALKEVLAAPTFAISGTGALALVQHYFRTELANLRVIARALEIEIHSDAGRMGLLSARVIDRLASAVVAAICDGVALPDVQMHANKLSAKYRTAPFNLPKQKAEPAKDDKTARKLKGAERAKEIAIARKADDRQKPGTCMHGTPTLEKCAECVAVGDALEASAG